jgi:hypothetical protein
MRRPYAVPQLTFARTLVLVILLFSLPVAVPLKAQTNSTWNAGTGNWSDASNWNPTVVPNNVGGATYNVEITAPNPLVVTMNVPNVSIDSLFVGHPASLSIDAGGNLTLLGSVASSNSGTINNYGTLNSPGVLDTGMGTINNYNTLNSSGLLIVDEGTLNNSGTLSSSGRLDVGNGLLINTGTINNSGILTGSFTNSGTLKNSGQIGAPGYGFTGLTNNEGGIISGTGSATCNFTNAGTMMPGSPTGVFTINGDYTQTSTGSLVEEVGWLNGNNASLLAVNGTADLDGTLELLLLSGYTPKVGDSFILMTFLQEFGSFNSITGLYLGNDEYLQLFYDPHDLRAVVETVPAPEPSSVLFVLVGLLAIAFAAFRSTRAA